MRLDQVLAHLAGIPRRRARALIDAGQLWLDGRPIRTLSRAVATGAVLDLLPPHAGAAPPGALPPVEILFEDRWLIAVHKPSGIAAAAPRSRRREELTVGEALLLALSARAGRRQEITLIHRLDRPTSGVMLFALHPGAARGLARLWQAGNVVKLYLAVIPGDPGDEPLVLDQPIERDPLTPGRFAPSPRGRPARTTLRTLARGTTHHLVEVRPLTGRSHQIRVHLAAAGWPVAGDILYGGAPAPRLMLHAWRLELPHPITADGLSLTAPPPDDFALQLHRYGLTLPAS